MADTVRPKINGVMRWSGGTIVLRTSATFDAADPVVLARPDVFTTDPLPPKTTAVAKPTRRCWVCRQTFEPSQTQQRYCSPEHRRQRERSLAATIRQVLQGQSADPKRPPGDCTGKEAAEYAKAVEARLSAYSKLSGYLAGRCDPGDPTGPPTPDPEISPKIRRKPGLSRLVGEEVRRLAVVRSAAWDFAMARERGARTAAELVDAVTTYGPRSAPGVAALKADVAADVDRWAGV
jgi:hypothetical protein